MTDAVSDYDVENNNNNLHYIMELFLEKSFQILAMIVALLISTTVSYFAGPSTVVVYLVVVTIPWSVITSIYPRFFCINIRGINFTSKKSDISWLLLYWSYWLFLNYIFFLARYTLGCYLWYIVPLNFFICVLALCARYAEWFSALISISMLVVLFPIHDIGIFREEYYITIVRVAMYFFGFYAVEMGTGTSGIYLLPYMCWILNVWKWVLPFFLFQLLYIFSTDYMKKKAMLNSSSSSNSMGFLGGSKDSKSLLPTTISPSENSAKTRLTHSNLGGSSPVSSFEKPSFEKPSSSSRSGDIPSTAKKTKILPSAPKQTTKKKKDSDVAMTSKPKSSTLVSKKTDGVQNEKRATTNTNNPFGAPSFVPLKKALPISNSSKIVKGYLSSDSDSESESETDSDEDNDDRSYKRSSAYADSVSNPLLA